MTHIQVLGGIALVPLRSSLNGPVSKCVHHLSTKVPPLPTCCCCNSCANALKCLEYGTFVQGSELGCDGIRKLGI